MTNQVVVRHHFLQSNCLQMMCVVYFDQLLGAALPESKSKYFFEPFKTFYVNFKRFSVLISGVKSMKNVKTEQKKAQKSILNSFQGVMFFCVCVISSH